MITQRALNFATVLCDMNIKEADVLKVNTLLSESEILRESLANPLVKPEEKLRVVEALCPESMWKFMRLLCNHHVINLWSDIFEAYEELHLEKQNIVKASLRYAMELDDQDIENVKDMICKKYNKAGVRLELIKDESLIGGMVLIVKNTEYDKSFKGTLEEMKKTFARR